jgi:hypothetical protein
MKRTSMIVAVLTLLTLPMMAGADDQGWMPPEWSPTPAARQAIDLVRMVESLRAKGVISDEEYSQLTRPSSPSSPRQGHGRAWTWTEIEHNPVRSTGGD